MVPFVPANGTRLEDTVPDGVFELTETFPTPASRWIQVAYRLHQPARVQFELFDMLGRKVQETDIAFQSSGSFQQTVDTSTLSSGRYVLRAISGPQAIIRLVTVIN